MHRVLQTQPKVTGRFLHASFHIIALIIAVIGLAAAFDFHYHAKIPDLYTLHSWVGMATVILFSFQVSAFMFIRSHVIITDQFLSGIHTVTPNISVRQGVKRQ